MPTKGNPYIKVRVERDLRERYAEACKALGLGGMSEDLRARIEAVVAEYEGRDKQS